MLKGSQKAQLRAHSCGEGTLQREREGTVCVTSILTSGCSPVRAELSARWNVEQPFQILTQARLQLQMPAARAPFPKHSLKEIFKL